MRRAFGVTLALALAACSSKKTPPSPVPSSTAQVDPPDASLPPERRVALDLVEGPLGCTFGHDGVVLDLGEASSRGDLAIKEPTTTVERDGASWERVSDRTLSLRFVPPSEGIALAPSDGGRPDLYVDARVRSLIAKSATVYLNGKALGTWSLPKGETKVVSAHSSTASLLPGSNQLVVRFNGVPKGSTDTVAELDWIRVGPQAEASYAATTRTDVIVTQAVGGVAKRALSVPAPGFARCVGFLPRGASLELAVGAAGKGDADVVLRAIKDRAPPRELATLRATDASWQSTTIALPEDFADTVAAIEITVPRASKGVRALLGDARVTTAPLVPPPARKPVKNALLVVYGQAPPQLLSTYGGKTSQPTLDALGKDGLVFLRHRATTSWAAGSFASALTGLLPPQHGVEDEGTRLSAEPVTIARAARDAGIQSALFTANPTTSAAYGFDRDWVDFAATLPPTEPAERVFDDAAQWLGKHKGERFLLVVHARGGHPPWDATAEELKTLAPDAYAGPLEPKHAAEILGKARRVPPLVRFGDADRARAWALFDLRMRAEDAALGRLLSALRDAGEEAETAVVVTGDSSTATAAHVPFGDDTTLDEGTLGVPLVVRLPAGSAPAPAQVSAPTSTLDLARSLLGMLGLAPPSGFGGVDVVDAAVSASRGRTLVATGSRGKVSLRAGSLVLFGSASRSQLCDVDLDPTCVTDNSALYPLSELRLRGEASSVFGAPPVSAPTIVFDPALTAAMHAWGR